MHDKTIEMLHYQQACEPFYTEKALNLLDMYYNNFNPKLDF